MTKAPSKPFNDTSNALLADPETAAMYLEEILADGDMDLFKQAIRHVAEARFGGMSALAEETDLDRSALYRALSKNGNPRFDTLHKVLHAAGLRLSVQAEAQPA